ncbi:MAG: carbamoyltransferase N-terminal domain-containing protein [Myxococcota bacterium]|nr:carbamoyltransferase N-terminal domain-containing protein [Myxococcota bacterium]
MSTIILGISAQYHDSAAALIRDGVVVAAASEERFSRLKHDASLPIRASRWCLEEAGATIDDVDYVVFYEKPLRKFERLLIQQLLNVPKSFKAFRRSSMVWLTDKLWVRNSLVKQLGVHPDKILWSEHHLSHAASVFYGSDLEEAAILTVDGVGEWATTGLWKGGPDGIEPIFQVNFPESIGLVYSAFTAFLGFRVNNGEYKVMGMAAYGDPVYEEQVNKVLWTNDDGSFAVNMEYLSYHYSATDSYTKKFETLFGEPRFPGSAFDPTSPEGKRFADIAASIQKVTEDCMVGLANRLHKETQLDHLCMAGGVALNSVANTAILERTPFKTLTVHPAAGDAGGSVGAALWAWNEVLNNQRNEPITTPGLGESWSHERVAEMLSDLKIAAEDVGDRVASLAAQDIADGKVIGWVQGGFEWGPRALGHRSILANPRDPDMQDRVNQKVKFRERFRPFAPSVLAGHEQRYFEIPEGADQPIRWMLMVVPVLEDQKAIMPSITHIDGTARIHVVEEDANPRYHELLTALGEKTGHPIVLNTSFNLKGEPIVSSPVYALATFMRCDIDVLYIDSFRIDKAKMRGLDRVS